MPASYEIFIEKSLLILVWTSFHDTGLQICLPQGGVTSMRAENKTSPLCDRGHFRNDCLLHPQTQWGNQIKAPLCHFQNQAATLLVGKSSCNNFLGYSNGSGRFLLKNICPIVGSSSYIKEIVSGKIKLISQPYLRVNYFNLLIKLLLL